MLYLPLNVLCLPCLDAICDSLLLTACFVSQMLVCAVPTKAAFFRMLYLLLDFSACLVRFATGCFLCSADVCYTA